MAGYDSGGKLGNESQGLCLPPGTCCLGGEEPEEISEHQDLAFLMHMGTGHPLCSWSSFSKNLPLHTELLLLTQPHTQVPSFEP